MTTIHVPEKIKELFRHYGNPQFLNIEVVSLDTPLDFLEKHFNKIYVPEKTELLLNAFRPGKKFLIDTVSLYDDDIGDTHYRVPGIRYTALIKTNTRLKIAIPLEQWFHRIKTSSRRKTTPAPPKRERVAVSLMRTPLVIEATFKITGSENEDIYGMTDIHDYYDALTAEVVAGQHGGGVSSRSTRGLAALKKQELIDRCKAKKIPYSGRTKAELVASLRR